MINGLFDSEILQSLQGYHRLFVGYSGGLDSTVLLHALSSYPQLQPKLTAVHINHGISPNAQNWQKQCQQFCDSLKIPLIVKQVHFKRDSNVEDAARRARYKVFASLIEKNDCLILAHHLNDQAETLLLHLLRGTGIDGLSGMSSLKKFAEGVLLRPLLHSPRSTLETYANDNHLQWIDDESNENTAFSRNFLRHLVIPLLASRWPKIINNLARTSKHCQQAQENLEDLAKIDCPELAVISPQLPLAKLLPLTRARLTNVLRVWLKGNQIKLPSTATFNRLISEVIHARRDANSQVSWGDNICVRRYQDRLYLILKTQSSHLSVRWNSFPEPLDLGSGRGILSAHLTTRGLVIPPNSTIEVKFRQGGETLHWHGQTKQLKKLFQDWQIPPWLRESIPLLYINQELACVVGYAISDHFYKADSKTAFQLLLTFN
ncbi:tRNA lysidine(34) synthetase TilS [Legionella hackeliae]|uniref:tRNA lysidine(34) synthetase TilS n=1 Tax=Legionella hackeliae TaxID=449 RepID=UPI00351A8584